MFQLLLIGLVIIAAGMVIRHQRKHKANALLSWTTDQQRSEGLHRNTKARWY